MVTGAKLDKTPKQMVSSAWKQAYQMNGHKVSLFQETLVSAKI